MPKLTREEARMVQRETIKLNAQAWGVSFGLLCGLSLFVATLVLVLKGGARVGQHLGLLSVYLPGYRVTLGGAFIGFIYLFVIGYALGRVIGLVYNYIAVPNQ
jgi:hypothetical protein